MTRVLWWAAWILALIGYAAALAGWRWTFLAAFLTSALLFLAWGFPVAPETKGRRR